MNKLALNNFQSAIQSLTKNNLSIFYCRKFQLSSNEKLNSFQGILRLQSSVVPVILVWTLLCGEYVSLVSSRYLGKPHILFPFCDTSLLNVKDSIPFGSCTRASVDDVQISSMK